jgi:hypothetical protein
VPEANRPFRWDLVRRDELGRLLDGTEPVNLWFADELVRCAAQVLARCADGDPYCVGRSVDSVFDLLGGALSGTSWQDRVRQLPLSLYGLDGMDLAPGETRQLRANLTAAGLAPADLMRGRPVVFVDLVYQGSTFTNLYRVLRDWIDDERAQWDVIRRKLRFLGITWRGKTSPNTWRWQQHQDWTADLPPRAIRNVSLDGFVWSYLGNEQLKTAPTFRRTRWADFSLAHPRHDKHTLQALAEAVALVEHGRLPETRRALAQVITTEPTITEPWLRTLARELT